MSDMTACLNDLSYIPLNNEQNEPSSKDIMDKRNKFEELYASDNEELYASDKFEELYASDNEELYPGCDYMTRLDFMAKFTYFKVKGKLTDSIFNEMLEFFQNVFPTAKGYNLPPSYYAIKKTFKTIGSREYGLLILQYWANAPEIHRPADLYEDLIKCCVGDAISEVRSTTRARYKMFYKAWLDRSRRLLSLFEYVIQRIINDKDGDMHRRHASPSLRYRNSQTPHNT
nr:CLIP-associated protein [Tanacetum cinerariifolium]